MLVKDLNFGIPTISFDVRNGSMDDITGSIIMGAITLAHGEDEFILDPVSTTFEFNTDRNVIEVVSKLEIDEDTFNEPNNYSLTLEQLFSDELTVEFYCSFEQGNELVENILVEMTIGLIKLQINATLED